MTALSSSFESLTPIQQPRPVSTGDHATVLTDIYQEEINIAIWQRKLADRLAQAAEHILVARPTLKISVTVTPANAFATINNLLGASQETVALSEDAAQLVDMFCFLFELKHVGLRLTTLDRAMCPRFHVDQVPCRLVTTYRGVATEWLPGHVVDRSKLGAGNQGKRDEQSGLFKNTSDIEQLASGHVALLKGERCEGNEGAGLVHRSPELPDNTHRLLLTIDFIED